MNSTKAKGSTSRERRRVAILGAGPVGLEAALAAVEAGYDVSVFEAAARPAANLRDWGHVQLFTPWSMNASPRMQHRLQEIGRPLEVDPSSAPTGHELADRVLDPLWQDPALARVLHLDRRVVAVSREGLLKHEEIATPNRAERPFRILLRDGAGRERIERAEVVLDCTGKYGHMNTLGDGGIPAPGENAVRSRTSRRIPDLAAEAERWRGDVLLVGSGHSAQTAARDLAGLAESRGDLRVWWVARRSQPDWGAVPDDQLPGRRALTDAASALATGASAAVTPLLGRVVDALEERGGRVHVAMRGDDGNGGSVDAVEVDHILGLTGGVGDHGLYRQLQVHECYATSGPMKLSAALLGAGSADCMDQPEPGVDQLRNPEPNFFILGDKSYGRNNTFLMRTGWGQVEEVFRAIDEAQ